jgi:hypothetical protein
MHNYIFRSRKCDGLELGPGHVMGELPEDLVVDDKMTD